MRVARIVEAHWYIVKITAFLERLIAAQGCFRALQSLIFRPAESAGFISSTSVNDVRHLSLCFGFQYPPKSKGKCRMNRPCPWGAPLPGTLRLVLSRVSCHNVSLWSSAFVRPSWGG